jgi:phospholipid/cholesterol/gamma-HCH transport system substrate-binding protein
MAPRGEQWAETGVGALVLAAAAGFLVYALGHASGFGGSGGGYELTARFGDVGSLTPGADVRVAGVKVGSVASIELDPKTFLARTRFLIQPQVKLPSDSTVKITSDGLLGGQHVVIAPGGAPDDLKPGAEFENAQGAVDLFGLIGQVIRPQAGGSQSGGGQAAGATRVGSASSGGATDPYPGGH